MKKYLFVIMMLVFSTLALARMMDWDDGFGVGNFGMMNSWWPFWMGLGVFGIFVGVLWVLAFVFWVWMLVDAIVRRFDDNIEKLIWVVVIVFLNIIGALIYYFIIKAKDRSSAVSKNISKPAMHPSARKIRR